MKIQDGALVLLIFIQVIILGIVIANRVDHADRWGTIDDRENTATLTRFQAARSLEVIETHLGDIKLEIGYAPYTPNSTVNGDIYN